MGSVARARKTDGTEQIRVIQDGYDVPITIAELAAAIGAGGSGLYNGDIHKIALIGDSRAANYFVSFGAADGPLPLCC